MDRYERWMKAGTNAATLQKRISAVGDVSVGQPICSHIGHTSFHRNRLHSLHHRQSQIGAAMLMGELGPVNAQDMMDPRPLLMALEETKTIALAWIWKCGGGADSLLTDSCDAATPNDANNGNWGSLFRNFTAGGTRGPL